jgi:hypothetical protein
MINDDYWDAWDSQHFNEFEFDESSEIAMIYKISALTDTLASKLHACLNSQKVTEQITQEVCRLSLARC